MTNPATDVVVEVPEWGQSHSSAFGPRTAAAIRTAALRVHPAALSVEPSAEGWMLRATSFVGTIRCGRVQITVTPKVSIRTLYWLLSHGDGPLPAGDDVPLVGEVDGTAWAVASALCTLIGGVAARGLVRGYVAVDERSVTVRGRIRYLDHARRLPGIATPLEITYDDFTLDTPENRILRAAVDAVIRMPGLPAKLAGRATAYRDALAAASRLVPGAPLPATPLTRLNAHYADALALGRLVLGSRLPETLPGAIPAHGFLIDLSPLFEALVDHRLGAALVAQSSGRADRQVRVCLDSGGRVHGKIDLLYRPAHGAPLVVDAKYKRLVNVDRVTESATSDMFQVAAYAQLVGANSAALVYPEPLPDMPPYRLEWGNVTLHRIGIDMSATPARAEASIAQAARVLSRSASTRTEGCWQ